MNSEYLNKQWWFMIPVVGATIASVFWLFSALGLGKPFELFTFPGVLLVVISGFSFHRFYQRNQSRTIGSKSDVAKATRFSRNVMPEKIEGMKEQIPRLRATWALWLVIAFIALNLTEYGWLVRVKNNFDACVAVSIVLFLSATGIHLCKRAIWSSACLFVAGLLLGLGLALAWGVSGGLGNSMFFSALPLIAHYRKSFIATSSES
jgi:hypothetical protein